MSEFPAAYQGVDLVIIGAGPAGMAAAIQATAIGLSVTVFDEQSAPGGQIFRNVDAAAGWGSALAQALGPDYAKGRDITRCYAACDAEKLAGATVAYITDDMEVYAQQGERLVVRRCRKILLATGALERPFPIPGWTLPGVISAGGIQSLLKGQALLPTGRVVVAGTGPLVYLVAAQLLAAGAADLAFLDTSVAGNFRRAMPALLRLARGGATSAAYLLKGIRLLSRVRRQARVHETGVRGLSAQGEGRVQRIQYTVGGATRSIDADWLVLHQGVMPNTQITRALDCSHRWDEVQLCWCPVVDQDGRTSRSEVFCAGDGAGILGAAAAQPAGRIAALRIAADLAVGRAADIERLLAQAHEGLALHRHVRPWLDLMYRPAPSMRIPEGDTVVCRCEDVRARQVLDAIAEGCPGPNQLKFFTRCGMGPCQGRYCGTTISEMFAGVRGIPVESADYFRIRQPLKPMRMGLLASTAVAVEKSNIYAV